MADYVSGERVDPNQGYAPADVTDPFLVWIIAARTNGLNSASAQLFGSTPMVEPSDQDQSIDIAGGGDPTGCLAHLVAPGTALQTLSLTWATNPINSLGFAMTLSGVDQTTPIHPTNGTVGNSYSGTASPILTYDAPDQSTALYWRIHAQATQPVWTDPAGFVPRFTENLLAATAFRTLRIWSRKVNGEDLGATVAATSDQAGDGIHGLIVCKPSVVAPSFKPFYAINSTVILQ